MKFGRLVLLGSLAAVLLVFPAGAQAAVITFNAAPADGAVLNTRPTIQWQYDAELTGSPLCALEKDGEEVVEERVCEAPTALGATLSGPPENRNVSWDLSASTYIGDGDDDGEFTVVAKGDFTVGGTVTATRTFKLDTVNPVVSISAPANQVHTNVKRPTFSFLGSDANPLNYTCWIASTAFGSQSYPCDAPSFTPPVDLADDAYTFQVTATDGANTGGASIFFNVDTVKPLVNIAFPTPWAVVDSSVPEVALTVDGATAGSLCRFDDNAFQSCDGNTWLGGSLSDGAHTLTVRATDLAGNVEEVIVPFFVDDSLSYGPPPQSVKLTNSKGSKVKRRKFTVKVALAVTPRDAQFIDRACTGSTTFAIKPSGSRKSYSKRIKLKRSGTRCIASGKVTLPSKFKRKRAKLTARYHGSMLISSLKRTRTIKKL